MSHGRENIQSILFPINVLQWHYSLSLFNFSFSFHFLLVVTISSKFHTSGVTAVNEANGSNETQAAKKHTPVLTVYVLIKLLKTTNLEVKHA